MVVRLSTKHVNYSGVLVINISTCQLHDKCVLNNFRGVFDVVCCSVLWGEGVIIIMIKQHNLAYSWGFL